ncbi:zinc ribbon domain-containing protein [Bacillus smithii]|uniref:zinc ribbon domain-containing protein n=1 Tax=Bacillus smithii TaxID=1479 RepID=UPI0022E6D348|nr:zinc ribbon domain-containing protein [Bacillus smithii]MED4884694.1 zinc ribbon domain-containing protein [Bacillus smithii]MED4927695.1 zinc ribbon domain-containing protein [Bacillus smithii]
MGELQTRIGGGLFKIKGGLEQGKQKVLLTQEILQHKKVIEEAGAKRADFILQLGEEVYRKMRSGEWEHKEWSERIAEIAGLDQTIYRAKQELQRLNQKFGSDNVCRQCGAQVTPLDKFCGSCGAKVVQEEDVKETETVACSLCGEQVPVSAQFCKCCGTKMH